LGVAQGWYGSGLWPLNQIALNATTPESGMAKDFWMAIEISVKFAVKKVVLIDREVSFVSIAIAPGPSGFVSGDFQIVHDIMTNSSGGTT